jgi:hypothetical protein
MQLAIMLIFICFHVLQTIAAALKDGSWIQHEQHEKILIAKAKTMPPAQRLATTQSWLVKYVANEAFYKLCAVELAWLAQEAMLLQPLGNGVCATPPS